MVPNSLPGIVQTYSTGGSGDEGQELERGEYERRVTIIVESGNECCFLHT